MSTPNPPSPSPTPLTLTYDNYSPAKDPNNRRLLPAYWLGTILAGFFHTAILIPILFFSFRESEFVPAMLFSGLVLPIGFAIVFSLPDIIFLGFALWLRNKLLKHSRFAKFRTALITGFIAGLPPMVLLKFLEPSDSADFYIFLFNLVWHILYPTAAAFWLCYKSNLRDDLPPPSPQ